MRNNLFFRTNMTTENVMKLGKIERMSFSFVLLSFLQIYRPWPFEKNVNRRSCRCIASSNEKEKKTKNIKNQFEFNSEKCIKMHMSGPKIHIELSVISR